APGIIVVESAAKRSDTSGSERLSARQLALSDASEGDIIGPFRGDGFPALMRVGIGHDTHRLAAGGPLRLGGIDIPHDKHAVGHSDADVLLHAITDALLGAAALGDIGELFPDTDPANKNRDSAEMLKLAVERVTSSG